MKSGSNLATAVLSVAALFCLAGMSLAVTPAEQKAAPPLSPQTQQAPQQKQLPQKQLPQQKQEKEALPPSPDIGPAVAPDLVVRIVSIGLAQAENRDPFTGRIETGPEAVTPVYVTIPFSVMVTNRGRTAARPVIVDVEESGGPAGYNFNFSVAGSRLPSCAYFDETIPAGGTKTIAGKLVSDQRVLPDYRTLEGRQVRFRAVVDPGYPGYPTVTETNERNNATDWTAPVTLPRAAITAPQPDVMPTITSITVDPSWSLPEVGFMYRHVTVLFTITNLGTAPFRMMDRCWEVSFYLPEERSPYLAGWHGASWATCSSDILPGQTVGPFHAEDIDVPDFATRIRVEVDFDNRVAESDEMNNAAVRPIIWLRPPDRVIGR